MKGPPEFAFVADCHVGNPKRWGGPPWAGINARGLRVLDVLERAVKVAALMGAPSLVVLGDLFDSSRATPQLVAAVMRLFAATTLQVFVLLGNHDQESTAPGDHALGPLALLPNVRVVERGGVIRGAGGCELWLVPFEPGNAREWLPARLTELSDHAKKTRDRAMRDGPSPPIVLGLHLGIIDGATAPFLRGAPDAIPLETLRELCTEHGIFDVLAGNWHERREWQFARGRSLHVLQVGALCPTGFSNPGLEGYGTLATWAPGELAFTELYGPRFVTVTTRRAWDEVLAAVKAAKLPGGGGDLPLYPPTYVRWVVEDPGAIPEAEALMRVETEMGLLAGGEVVPGVKAAEASAHEAARVARRAATLAEAVEGYVRGLNLPDDDGGPVLELVRGYMGGAA